MVVDFGRLCRIVRILMLAVFAAGWGFQSLSATDCRDACLEDIDSLLLLHDRCEWGYQHPDSATYYTITALQKADLCYGMESEVYGNIFTDYMIHDWSDNKEMIMDYIYPVVVQELNPFTSWIWRTYYKLGLIMESHAEYAKARSLFEMANMARIPKHKRLKVQIQIQRMNQKLKGGNLERMLEPLINEISAIEDMEDRAEVAYRLAYSIAEYYSEAGNDEKALEFIAYGEQLTGWIGAHELMMLLDLKYHILKRYDHIAAVECLDKAIELAKAK